MIEIIQADGTREQAVIAAMRRRAAEQNSEIERAVRALEAQNGVIAQVEDGVLSYIAQAGAL